MFKKKGDDIKIGNATILFVIIFIFLNVLMVDFLIILTLLPVRIF